MSEEKGLSYVPQILSEHKAATDSSQNSYEHAVKCGELLNAAKQAVGKGWTEYCDKHLRHIPQTTRSLYMRLAKPDNQAKINERITELAKLGEEGRLSIRSAAKLLPSTRTGKTQAEKDAEKANRVKATVETHVEEYISKMDADALAELILKAHPDDDYLNTLVELVTPEAPKDDGMDIPQSVRRLH
jgi:hypothetical protein